VQSLYALHCCRLVKLMTGSAGEIETIVADFLFVLCKENRKWVYYVTLCSCDEELWHVILEACKLY